MPPSDRRPGRDASAWPAGTIAESGSSLRWRKRGSSGQIVHLPARYRSAGKSYRVGSGRGSWARCRTRPGSPRGPRAGAGADRRRSAVRRRRPGSRSRPARRSRRGSAASTAAPRPRGGRRCAATGWGPRAQPVSAPAGTGAGEGSCRLRWPQRRRQPPPRELQGQPDRAAASAPVAGRRHPRSPACRHCRSIACEPTNAHRPTG
jgi:hypothetical protein